MEKKEKTETMDRKEKKGFLASLFGSKPCACASQIEEIKEETPAPPAPPTPPTPPTPNPPASSND